MDDAVTLDELQAIAEDAYVHAFPMLMGYRFGYAIFVETGSPSHAGPANDGPFGDAITLDHAFKDVITRWEGQAPEGSAASHRFKIDPMFLLGRTQLLGADD